jgi:O-antigen/teichoic acid export membrane protein
VSDAASGDPRFEEQAAPHRLERAARSDRQLLARSSLTLVSRGFSKFAQIFFLVIAARLLSTEEFASYSYILVLAAAFTILSDTGVPIVASRDASAGRAPVGDLFHAALPVVAVSAAIAALTLPLVGAVDSGPGSSFVPILLAAGFVLFNRFFDFTATMLRGIGRFTFEAALQAGGAAVFILGASITTAAGLGVTAVLAVLAAKELLSGLIAYAAIRGDLRLPEGRPRRVSWRQLLSVGIRLSIAGIALALVMRIPLAVLGNIGSAEEVAHFSAAQRFGDAIYLFAVTCGFALLPGLSYLVQSEPERARRLVHRTLIALTGASAVLALVTLPIAEPVMRLIFGSDFAAGAGPLRIILVGMPGYAALGVCWYAVVAYDGERRLLGIGVTGLLICGGLCVALVPTAADEGAAWAYVGSLYVMAVLSFAALAHESRRAKSISQPPEVPASVAEA